jgi:aldose 1-epimerase
MKRPAPTGGQFRIADGEQAVTVVEIGAAVREYRVADREVFQSYGEHEVSWGFHGSVLVPWANRLADGQYEFDGERYQLALTEPERGTALHGLGAWQRWSLIEHVADRVALRLDLLPSPGYPFHLDTVVEYSLDADGLRVVTKSTNTGDQACPYALGFHPYLSAGPGATLDDCRLRIDASRRLLTDDRLLPAGDEPVDGSEYDFRVAQSLAGRSLDDGYSDVVDGIDGLSWVCLTGPDGHTGAVWADAHFGFWQVYSGDALPQMWARRSLAVEPMTAPSNAFRSGRGLIRLEPGDTVTASWGAKLL